MRTEYYCRKCGQNFSDEKVPNINKLHRACGSLLKIVRHARTKDKK